MNPLDTLRSRAAELQAEVAAFIAADEAEFTDELRARFEFATEEFETTKAELDAAELRHQRLEAVRTAVIADPENLTPGHDTFGIIVRNDPFETSTAGESSDALRSRAFQVLENTKSLSPSTLDGLDATLRSTGHLDGGVVARRLLITQAPAYRSAFGKILSNRSNFTQEEAAALNEFDAIRAQADSPGSAGGYGLPVFIDPSIMLASGAVNAPVTTLCRVVNITTNNWKGVVAPSASSWSFDAEGTEVSDDSFTLSQPSIPVWDARGFVPYSIDVSMDYPDWASELGAVLQQGFIDLLARKTINGVASSSEINGVFTAVAATTTNPAHVVVTTAGSVSGADIRAAWAALPERFRANATWLTSKTGQGSISGLGNGLQLSDYTVNLLADGTYALTGRPLVASDYVPSFTTTTTGAGSQLAVVGDFAQGYVLVNRLGMTVETVQHLIGSNGRPTGQRGLYAYARLGGDVVLPNAFRQLGN